MTTAKHSDTGDGGPDGTTVLRRLEFDGGRSATGAMTWGQLAIWDVIRWLPAGDTSLNSTARREVPPGTTLDQVLAALRALVERHDSLHTLYREGPEGPRQQVVGRGRIDVRVCETGPEAVDAAAERIGEAVRLLPFDSGTDLPLRPVVLTRDSAPVAVLLVVSHMAVDGWSLAVLGEDLAALLSRAPLAPAGEQPLERAGYETTGLARDRERRALAHWRERIATLPPRMLGPVSGSAPAERDLRWSRLESTALARAAAALGARCGTETGVVVMAAVTALAAAYTGEEEAALRTIVATRFRPEDRRFVGALNQNALLCVALTGESFPDFVRRTRNAALRAFRHTEYDPRALETMIAEVARERGITAGRYCFFNDVRFAASRRVAPAEPEPPDALAAALCGELPRTTVGVPPLLSPPKGAGLFVFLDGDRRTRLTVGVADGFLRSGGAEEFARGVESLIVRGALTSRPVRELCADLVAAAPGTAYGREAAVPATRPGPGREGDAREP